MSLNSASVEITISPLPIVDAGLSPEPLCSDGGSVQLTGTGIPLGGTGIWSDSSPGGNDYITTDGFFEIPEGGIPAGNYEVTYTYTTSEEDGGCTDSDTVIVPVVDCLDCGTAFGVAITGQDPDDGEVDTSISTCFREEGFKRWGWTNSIAENSGETVLQLWRGAGRCILEKGTYVGDVIITYEDNMVSVVYDMADGVGLDEAHLYIGCKRYPEGPNGKSTVAPGQYTFNSYDLTFNEGTYSLAPIPAQGDIFVIAHAVACINISAYVAPNGFVPASSDGEFVIDGEPGDYDMTCTVGVENELGKSSSIDFKTYPVPFTDEVNVGYKFEYETDVNVQVYDIKGSLIRSVDNKQYIKGTYDKTRIDLSNADNQLYFVRVTTNEGTLVKKIVSLSAQE